MNKIPPPGLAGLPWMTPWFGPKALAQTGLRAVTSEIILSQIDQRILQATIDGISNADLIKRYDHSNPASLGLENGAPVWVDYVADSGDGFESTYSIASLMAAPGLQVKGLEEPLPAGQILVMGGDQAYPYASDDEYQKRLVTAYDLTIWNEPQQPPTPKRKLFALPGNHDWYDGLSSFERLFCTRRDGLSSGRTIGGWHCQQHRSYWAVQLPYDWWIWGLDVQLNQSLDIGQIRYFHAVAQHMSAKLAAARKLNPEATEPKIIMCIPTPSWHAGHEAASIAAYSRNLLRILNLAIDQGKVCAVLTGDLHHYSRYFSKDHRLNLFTAGGGGAYLAPTHDLPSKINVPWRTTSGKQPTMLPFTLNGPAATDDAAVVNTAGDLHRESVFPSKRTSRWLSWHILLFPIYNPTFCMALGALYFLMWWFYTSTAIPLTNNLAAQIPSYAEMANIDLRESPINVNVDRIINRRTWFGLWEQFRLPFSVARWSPAFALTAILIFGMIWGFLAGAKQPWRRVFESSVVWLGHVFAMAALAQIILSFVDPAVRDLLGSEWRVPVNSALMFILGSGIAGTMCGIYLFLGNRVFLTHLDNGFSACRIASYKNFLRMRITNEELTIYPIGLRNVPKSRIGWRPATEQDVQAGRHAAYFAKEDLRPELIEGPIRIKPKDIVNLT